MRRIGSVPPGSRVEVSFFPNHLKTLTITVHSSAWTMIRKQSYAEDIKCVIISSGFFNILERVISYVATTAPNMLLRQYCPILNMRQQAGHHLYDTQAHHKWRRRNGLPANLWRRIRVHRLLAEGVLRILLPRRLNYVGWDGQGM